MKRLLAWSAALFLSFAAAAQAPAPGQFAWRAPLELPAGAGVARTSLPASALLQMQSAQAHDVRVFNAGGEAVAFAFIGTPAQAAPPQAQTPAYAALPLYGAQPGSSGRPGKGAVRVRVQDGDQRSVWVQMDGRTPDSPAVSALQAVLFDTRAERQRIAAFRLDATLPPNTPVRLRLSTSPDLAQWTPLAVHGRIYRFEGPGAPVNDTLQLASPVELKDRYLRIDWDGQDGVAVRAMTGIAASAAQTPLRVAAELPALQAGGRAALQLRLPFATPIASLQLATAQPNTLLPVRLLGRNDPAAPWRTLAQAVVWRVGEGPDAGSPPITLHGASVRWLRLESTNGADLAAAKLKASVAFEPVQLAFVASGSGPFTLAVGRADTPSAALPASMLAGALAGRTLQDLPEARVGAASVAAAAPPDALDRLLPEGLTRKTAILWAVLLLGVAVLGGVAWSLLRQLKQ